MKMDRERVVSALQRQFPTVSADFLRSFVRSYPSTNIEQNSASEEGILRELSEKLRMFQVDFKGGNAVLAELSDIFPDVQWDHLKRIIIKFWSCADGQRDIGSASKNGLESCVGVLSKSVLQQCIETLLSSSPSMSPLLSETHHTDGQRRVGFRSSQYKRAALNELSRQFPDLWMPLIKHVFARSDCDYCTTKQRLIAIRTRHSVIASVFGFVSTRLDWVKRSLGSSNETVEQECEDEDLLKELEDERKREIEERELLDRNVASELQLEVALETGAYLTCQCCFGECIPEEVVTCYDGHCLCRICLRSYVSELLFGERGAFSADGIPCFAALTEHDCHAHIADWKLEHALPKELYSKFHVQSVRENMKRARLDYIQCAHCNCAEFVSATRSMDCALIAALLLLLACCVTLYNGNILYTSLFAIAFALTMALLQMKSPLRKQQHSDASRCRACAKWTCLKCKDKLMPFHKCAVDQHEADLKRYVEHAMSMAIIRQCPQCKTSLAKDDGCNKLTCKCGYSICYVCRADLRREGYSHFCQHFRDVPGECNKCRKCDLWKAPDETRLIQDAAKRAKSEFQTKSARLRRSEE